MGSAQRDQPGRLTRANPSSLKFGAGPADDARQRGTARVRLMVCAGRAATASTPVPPGWLRPAPRSSIGTKGSYSPSDSPVETVMMLSFAALVLRGRARDGSLAAIMVPPA